MLLKLVMLLRVLVHGAQIGLVSGIMNRQTPAQWVVGDVTSTEEPPVTIARIDNKCSRNPASIAAEFVVAAQMAFLAANNFNAANQYVQAFWPSAPPATKERFLDPYWLNKAENFLLCVARAVTGTDAGDCGNIDRVHVTCVEDEECTTKKGFVTLAHTDYKTETINLCNAFFDQPDSANIQCVDRKALRSYESKARALVHEITHLAIPPLGPTTDVKSEDGKYIAYGTGECTNSASSDFHGVDSTQTIDNADNYAYIAAENPRDVGAATAVNNTSLLISLGILGTYWLAHCIHKTDNSNFRLPADTSIFDRAVP